MFSAAGCEICCLKLCGSLSKKIKINIMIIDKMVEMKNVGRKPAESAIHPPMMGAIMAAGATMVWARPMYMGRSASLLKLVDIVMEFVHMETLAKPVSIKIG